MKTIKITIEGTSPLLMNRYNVERELQRMKGIRKVNKTYDSKIEAENSAYWTTSGKKELCIPANCLYASLLGASSFHKIGKRSAKPMLAGSIRILPEEIRLGTAKYEIDIRPVVISRQRVLKHRAKLNEWSASFEIAYNEKVITGIEVIKDILSEAGERVGLLDFRPQKGGWFGTFKITKFEPQ
jgi:hypothetical protein